MPSQAVFGLLAVVVGLIGYVPYVRDIARGRTKPHLFSWIVWALIQGVACAASLVAGGGAGAWFLGVAALLCAGIAVAAVFRGEKRITRLDWLCFILSLFGIVAWVMTSNPMWAVVIVSIADFLGFVPTFRKVFSAPREETLVIYAFASLANALALLAIGSYSITTTLYTASLVLSNALFVVFALWRRSIIKNHA